MLMLEVSEQMRPGQNPSRADGIAVARLSGINPGRAKLEGTVSSGKSSGMTSRKPDPGDFGGSGSVVCIITRVSKD